MLKRITKYAIGLAGLIVLVGGCSEFFGTITARIAANKHAIDYVSKEYSIPLEHLEADIPSYRYGQRLYTTEIHNINDQKIYYVHVRMWGEGDVMDIYEQK